MNIGQTILKIRKSRKITQEELAKKSELSKSYISMIESGKKKPTLVTLEKISNSLGIPFSILSFLSFNIEEVPSGKKEIFEKIMPEFKEIIENLYL